jgi:tetratricopeptide (TPR) repeat protein
VTPNEEKLLAETRAVDDEAYDLYMRGRVYLEQFMSRESLERAEQYFKRAIEKDPTWASPYAGIAEVGLWENQMHFVPQSVVKTKIIENAEKALELDPISNVAHYSKALVAGAIEWDWEKMEIELKKALELNPNYALAHVHYAHLLMGLRRTEESLCQAKKAVELDPSNPLILGLSVPVLIEAGESQTALSQAEKALSIEPNQWFVNSPLARSYLATGDTLKWYKIMRNKRLWWMDNPAFAASLDEAFAEGGYIGAIKERIRQNEEVYNKGGQILFSKVGYNYMVVGNYEKAMDYYEKAYETHDPSIAYIGTNFHFDKMKNNPRYIALLEKMNLPVD